MEAIIVKPPEAGITFQNLDYKNNGIKIKILENGICGTDREIVKGQLNSAAIGIFKNFDSITMPSTSSVITGSSNHPLLGYFSSSLPIFIAVMRNCSHSLLVFS